ncbi:MAG TPA: hypothetical protein VKV32_01875, partial [Stellaceae bacterium]|nr:hypothetical protein [Stellaceae bacterium]
QPAKDIASKITPARWREYYDAIQSGIARLEDKLASAAPDVIVIICNDQREMFGPGNTPMFAVYAGKDFKSIPRRTEDNVPRWAIQSTQRRDFERAYSVDQELARHLIAKLIDDDFDIAVCETMPAEIGMGHGALFLYERLLAADKVVPVVPVIINTFYPPNQAPIRRCYRLGRAIHAAVSSFAPAKRVAIVCSGGLSHFAMDEELDRSLLDAIRRKDRDALMALPEQRMVQGTSELRNWIAAAGALEPLDMTLVDYFQAPRTLGGDRIGIRIRLLGIGDRIWEAIRWTPKQYTRS